MPAGGWVSGSLSSAADVDRYSITLNAGDTVYLSLDPDPERDGTWNPQVGLGRFGSPAVDLLANDGSSTSPNSEAFFATVKDAGTYGIVVSAPGTTFGTYRLSVSVLPASAAPSTTYTSGNVPVTIPTGPGTATSTLTISDSKIIGQLKVFLNLTHNLMADLDVSLTSPTGNTVSLFTDVGSASAGANTGMDIGLDDNAAVPIGAYGAVVTGLIFKPEASYRLDWFTGEQAQGTWTLTIRDDLAGNGGTLNGWSLVVVDAPPLPTGTPTTVFATDFEANNGGFTHSGTQDEWEWGTPAFAPITTANSGTNAWKTDLDNTYNASANEDLFSPNVDLTAVAANNNVVFQWAMTYQIETTTFDHAFVEVQEVGGAGATRKVWECYGSTMTDTVGSGASAATIQEAAGWGRYRALINDFIGKTIRLRFHLDSDTSVQLGGLAIDDVSVTAINPNTPPTVTADNATVAVNEGQTAANTGTFSDPDAGQTIALTASVGTVSPGGTQSGTWSWSFTTTDGPPDSQTVTITATDSAGGVSTVTFALTVNNLPPTGNPGGPYSTPFNGGSVTLNGSATDPAGAADPLTFTWDLDGDGIFGETGAAAAHGDEVGANPTFNAAGLPGGPFVVSMRVADGDGGTDTDTTTVTINIGLPFSPDNVVQLRQSGTSLYVTGDAKANGVAIVATATGLLVRPATSGTKFTLVGSTAAPSAGPFTFTGVQSITVSMAGSPAGSADRLVFVYDTFNLAISGGISIQGQNALEVLTTASAATSLTVGGPVSVVAGVGTFTAHFTNVRFNQLLTLNHLNTGDSDVTFDTAGGFRNRLYGVDLKTGIGFDRTRVSATDVVNNLMMALGNGPTAGTQGSQTDVDNVTVGALWKLTAGTGTDVVNVQAAAGTSRFGTASIALGAGDDSLTLGAGGLVEFLGTAAFDGGTGLGDTLTRNMANLLFHGASSLAGWELVI